MGNIEMRGEGKTREALIEEREGGGIEDRRKGEKKKGRERGGEGRRKEGKREGGRKERREGRRHCP